MNSLFRKIASPLVSSIFRKGSSGLGNSIFRKAPSVSRILGGVRKATDVVGKLTDNPILEGLAKQQGFGDTFNLAKTGVKRVNRIADVGEKAKQEGANILEKVRALKKEGGDAIKFG